MIDVPSPKKKKPSHALKGIRIVSLPGRHHFSVGELQVLGRLYSCEAWLTSQINLHIP